MAIALTGGALVTVTAAVGDTIGSGTAEAPRDIAITMTDDLRFDPADTVVVAGETVRFVLHDPTAAIHDFTLGDLEAQELHAAEMASGMMHHDAAHDEAMMSDGGMMSDGVMLSGDAMAHDEAMPDDCGMAAEDAMAPGDGVAPGPDEVAAAGLPAPVTIQPGETVTVLATFDEPGEVLIGCHQPGHWEAGMKGTVTVVPLEA